MSEKPWVKTYAGGKPNYTTPEETRDNSSWVGLTDEEISEYAWMGPDVVLAIEEVQEILKERNNG